MHVGQRLDILRISSLKGIMNDCLDLIHNRASFTEIEACYLKLNEKDKAALISELSQSNAGRQFISLLPLTSH